jgi:hypothetical protein
LTWIHATTSPFVRLPRRRAIAVRGREAEARLSQTCTLRKISQRLVTELTLPGCIRRKRRCKGEFVEQLIERYFAMWNSGDTAAAPAVLAPQWLDHSHPEVSTPAAVAESVTRIRAARPAMRFTLDSVHGPVALGRVENPPAEPSLLAWVFTSDGDRLTSVRTYRAV